MYHIKKKSMLWYRAIRLDLFNLLDGFMKKKIVFVLLLGLAVLLFFGACDKKPENPNILVMDSDTSYSIGMYLAWQFMLPDVRYDYKAFMEGFRAYNEIQETKFSMDDAIVKIEAFFEILAQRDGYYDDGYYDDYYDYYDDGLAFEKGIAFLEENGRRPEVITTESGLQYEVLIEGTGNRPGPTSFVLAHYEGMLVDGFVFDSSYNWGEPLEFPLDGVIEGWTEGLQYMREGSTYMLYIPFDLGYGPYPAGSIPAYSTLIFRVELIAVY